MAIGAQSGSIIGPDRAVWPVLTNFGLSTFAMAATTQCWAARFVAKVAKKPKSIVTQWTGVVTPGTAQLGVETIDATTGKPNTARTLYDANATFDLSSGSSPALATGILTCTFAILPSVNVAIGTEYAVTLRTSVAGTTQTLASHTTDGSVSKYPCAVLTSTDAGSTWAEISTGIPVCTIIWDDDTCEDIGLIPWSNTVSNLPIYSTVVGGQKIVLGGDESIAGVISLMRRIGTPAGDLRCRIFDASNNVISGTEITTNKNLLTNINGRNICIPFPPVALVAGTYRVIFDSASSVDSSNCYRVQACTFLHSAAVPSGFRSCTASDGSADSTTQIAGVGLLIDSQTAGGGGGGMRLAGHGGLAA